MLVFSKNRKFLCFWTLGTSILTSEKNYPNVFCSAFPNLPNAVFRFSLTCVVFEIVGGGGNQPPPPGRWCSAETTGCARVKQPTTNVSSRWHASTLQPKPTHAQRHTIALYQAFIHKTGQDASTKGITHT